MVWLRLTEYFQLKSRHLKWVPFMWTEEHPQKRVDGARTILDTLEAQQRIGFREIVTGDESWIYLQIRLDSIWIGLESTKQLPFYRGRW
jgi:hypothetical protein